MEKNYRAELTGCFGDPIDGNPTGVMEEPAAEGIGDWTVIGQVYKNGVLTVSKEYGMFIAKN